MDQRPIRRALRSKWVYTEGSPRWNIQSRHGDRYNSTFSRNWACSIGVSIFNDEAMIVSSCTFSGNFASIGGGGVYAW